MDLDIRTFNAVKRAGIKTVEELRELPPDGGQMPLF